MEILVLGEALMDCIRQPDGSLRALKGGSPYNAARAASLQGAAVGYLNPLSRDAFGVELKQQLIADGVAVCAADSAKPTSLAVIQLRDGQPSYGFYREGIADRDYTVAQVVQTLAQRRAAIVHTGSLLLIPPESDKLLRVLQSAKSLGWILSLDVNLRPSVAADLDAYVAAVHGFIGVCDWLKASDEDLATLGYATHRRGDAAAMAQQLHALGPSRVALTYGAQGAYLSVAGVSAQADVPQVALVDSVGAGDTFWGTTLALWSAMDAAQAQAEVATTLRHAMQAAAINCSRAGCQPPTRQEVLAAQ